MTVLIICCILLTALYALLMGIYAVGWKMQPAFIAESGWQPLTRISVIIPARNEAANIRACLQSILAQDYPAALMEIIVVDDHSDDDTAALAAASSPRVRVVRLREVLNNSEAVISFKKKALATGIENSSGALIVTTDADCIAPPGWLRQIVEMQAGRGAAMIIGPVAFLHSGRLVEVFQSLDFMTMQGITAAAHRLRLGGMANGANLAFTRNAYDAVNGYAGIDHLASGDDYLLLHKISQRFPRGVAYLKSDKAIVSTAPQPDLRAFLQQRIRWASKSGKYPDVRLTAVLGLVYLFNVAIAAVGISVVFGHHFRLLFTAMLFIKILSEIIFLIPVAGFFKKGRELYIFPFLQPLHIMYIVLAGFLGMTGSYRWKGRKVR